MYTTALNCMFPWDWIFEHTSFMIQNDNIMPMDLNMKKKMNCMFSLYNESEMKRE